MPLSTPDPGYAASTEAFSLNSWRSLVAQLCDASANGFQQTLILMLITMLASFRIQQRWITIAIVSATMLFVSSAAYGGSRFELLFGLVSVALFIVALFRLGPLAPWTAPPAAPAPPVAAESPTVPYSPGATMPDPSTLFDPPRQQN